MVLIPNLFQFGKKKFIKLHSSNDDFEGVNSENTVSIITSVTVSSFAMNKEDFNKLGIDIADAFMHTKWFKSKSEIRRAITAGAIHLDRLKITNPYARLDMGIFRIEDTDSFIIIKLLLDYEEPGTFCEMKYLDIEQIYEFVLNETINNHYKSLEKEYI